MWQRKKILRAAGITFLVLLVGAGAFTLYLDHRVRTEFEGRRFALPVSLTSSSPVRPVARLWAMANGSRIKLITSLPSPPMASLLPRCGVQT
jgi:hypothetical protein